MRHPEGSVIHGIATCENVYRILYYAEHPTLGELAVLRIEKMLFPPPFAPEKMKVGKIILRAESSWDLTHLAKDCPSEA